MVDETVPTAPGQTGGGVEAVDDSGSAATIKGPPPFVPTGAPSVVVVTEPGGRPSIPVVYEDLPVGPAAVGFAKLPDKGYAKSVILFSVSPVNYRVDGGNPTEGSGYLANDGDWRTLSAHEGARFRAIRQGEFDAILRATHYAWL